MTTFAAADLGSNTFRLVVARQNSKGSLVETGLCQRVVRLGEGLGEGGQIREGALRRAAECIGEFGGLIKRLRPDHVFVAMTAAGRDLSGGERIISLVEEHLGATVTIPTGEDEAKLSFTGAAALLNQTGGNTLLLDIGGGSTEIAAVRQGQAGYFESLRLGVVRLTEAAALTAPTGVEGFRDLKSRAQKVMEESGFKAMAHQWREVFGQGGGTLVSNAGTPLTLAAMKTGKPLTNSRELTGVSLRRGEVEKAGNLLGSLTTEEIRAIPAVVEGREDVIQSGVAILLAFMEFTGALEVKVSDGGLCEGLLLSGAAKVLGFTPTYTPR